MELPGWLSHPSLLEAQMCAAVVVLFFLSLWGSWKYLVMFFRVEVWCSGIPQMDSGAVETPGYLDTFTPTKDFIPNVNSDEAEDLGGANHFVFLNDSHALRSCVGTHVSRSQEITPPPGSQLCQHWSARVLPSVRKLD